MKKLCLGIFSFVFIFLTLFYPSSGLAQEPEKDMISAQEKMIAPDYYPRPDSPLPFAGQNHAYSVVLRGNGEAIVTLKAAITNSNPDGEDLNTLTLRIPLRVIPSDIAVYQIINQGYCIRYEQRIGYESNQYMPEATANYYQPRCIEYSEPDYFNYYGGGKYQRAQYEYSGDTLTVNLPTAIKAEKSGAFFVYFRALGYARKNLAGAYKFNFESLKSNDPINQLNVGISTDSDLYLKGSKGEVDYRFADTAMMMKEGGRGGGAPAASSAIDRVVSQIGQGTIVKTASNLAPLESYKVSGMYANSKIKLYGKEILAVIAVVLIVILVIFLVIRKILGMMTGPVASKKGVSAISTRGESAKLVMTSLGISFISSVLLAGYSLLIIFVSQNLNYIDYQTAALLRLAGMIFSFCVYSVIIFIPGIYFGVKKGIGWGILTVVLTVGWLFVYLIVSIGIIFLTGFQRSYPPGVIRPMMEKFTN